MLTREEKFKQIELDNRSRIFRICRAYVPDPDEANDLYQEIMVQVWQSLPTFRGEAKLSTWLYRIALNTAIVFRRKQQRQPTSLTGHEAQLADTGSAKTEALEQEQLLNKLHRCIAQLQNQERLIISLVLEEVPYKEIAEVLGISTSNVGVKINRIKKKIGQLMEKETAGNSEREGGQSYGF